MKRKTISVTLCWREVTEEQARALLMAVIGLMGAAAERGIEGAMLGPDVLNDEKDDPKPAEPAKRPHGPVTCEDCGKAVTSTLAAHGPFCPALGAKYRAN